MWLFLVHFRINRCKCSSIITLFCIKSYPEFNLSKRLGIFAEFRRNIRPYSKRKIVKKYQSQFFLKISEGKWIFYLPSLAQTPKISSLVSMTTDFTELIELCNLSLCFPLIVCYPTSDEITIVIGNSVKLLRMH